MKLNNQKWEVISYGDYVEHVEVTETKPENRLNARYVSVEHIEPAI